jgi:2-ketocyclohexanecarboxyl-CoA hydrolase
MGLINEVVPTGELEQSIDRWLAEIHALSPRYLDIAKVSPNPWWAAAAHDMRTSLEALIQAIGSDDVREGARAFIEKRRPTFRAEIDARTPKV